MQRIYDFNEQIRQTILLIDDLVSNLTPDEIQLLLLEQPPIFIDGKSKSYQIIKSIFNSAKSYEADKTYKNISGLLLSELKRQGLSPELVADAFTVIGNFTDTKTLGRFSQASPLTHSLFKLPLTARELLRSVLDGNLNMKTTHLLARLTPGMGDMVLERVDGIEACGRSWKSVSSLEFAAWIGDMELVNQLLAQVSKHKKAEALAQLRGVREKGLEHGKHMEPFHTLREAYYAYDEFFECHCAVSVLAEKEVWDEAESMQTKYLVKNIGKKQFLLSLFGLELFCDDEVKFAEFGSNPIFTHPLRRSVVFKGKSLYPLISSGLGEKFFLYKWRGDLRRKENDLGPGHTTSDTITTLDWLCKTRLAALDSLISNLQNEIDNQETIPLKMTA